MELSNEFTVAVPPAEAWAVLADVEHIAPMLPGAELQEIDGDTYRGVVKVKVGPITAQYRGEARFVERAEDEGRVVLEASGRDTRGQGNASARITARLAPEGDGTRVTVDTDLTITGKVAQFGRGVLADVSTKLIGQFVAALEADLAAGGSARAAAGQDEHADAASPSAVPPSAPAAEGAPSSPSDSGPRVVTSTPAEPIDLLDVAGGSLVRRLVPVIAAVAAALGALWWRSRRRRR
jgi:carbon monoxide dehydrogenase subunit G